MFSRALSRCGRDAGRLLTREIPAQGQLASFSQGQSNAASSVDGSKKVKEVTEKAFAMFEKERAEMIIINANDPMGFSMSKDSEKEWEKYSKNLQKNTKKNVENVDKKVMPQTSYVYTSYDKKATAEVTMEQNDPYWEYVKKNPLGFEKSEETEKEWEKYVQNLRKNTKRNVEEGDKKERDESLSLNLSRFIRTE